jgi:hypothetical protein
VSVLLLSMEIAAIFLLAPLTIFIGSRRPTGAIIVSGTAATVAAILFWIFLGGFQGDARLGNTQIFTLLFFGGLLLLVTAWSLALSSAASTHRWGWMALLVVSGYISFTAVFIGLSTPNPCNATQVSSVFSNSPACAGANPLVSLAFQASHFVGPVAATLYGFQGASSPSSDPLPPDVAVTPLGTGVEEDTGPEPA